MQGDDGLRDTSHARDDDYLDAGTGIDLVRGGGGTDTMLNAEAGGRLGCTPIGISGKNPQRQLSFTPGHRYDAWARWFGEIGHSTN